jgi:hypothetical protein
LRRTRPSKGWTTRLIGSALAASDRCPRRIFQLRLLARRDRRLRLRDERQPKTPRTPVRVRGHR